MNLETIAITLDSGIASVELNRPDKSNAMNRILWEDIRRAFEWVDRTPEARVAVLSGRGRHFTSGIDLDMLVDLRREAKADGDCEGRAREQLRRFILDLQDTLTSIERCRKPVLAAIHGACIGGGIDLVSACDIRYCSADAFFAIREIDVGLTADVGTLQRLPKIIGDGITRELAYTGRKVASAEAREIGLVNRRFETCEALMEGVMGIAQVMAAKSPLALRGCKEMIVYSRDHSVPEGLRYVATWNAAMLLSDDLGEALTAMKEKRSPRFKD